jgi:hypothetical protein
MCHFGKMINHRKNTIPLLLTLWQSQNKVHISAQGTEGTSQEPGNSLEKGKKKNPHTTERGEQ